MKIIARTEDGFIVEASKEDIAGIQGMYTHEKRFEIGDMIDIAGLHDKYRSVAMAFNDTERLLQAAKNIENSVDFVKSFRGE